MTKLLIILVIGLFTESLNVVIGQSFPTDFSQSEVTSGLSNPTTMVFAPDGRIFIAEQAGKIRIVKNGSLVSAPFINLNVHSSGERGLLGIAFDPNFTSNNYIYLYYTRADRSNNRISRFEAQGDKVVPGSETIILELDPLENTTNHNGGALHFGPDGKLYVAVGDNAKGANAPNLDTYFGKMLRINPDGSAPSDNPYTSGSSQKRRIWSSGFRNPFTFDIQEGTGKVFVNDVGNNGHEEINNATSPALNFGWPDVEGNSSNPIHTNPVYFYKTTDATGDDRGCAITGGTFLSNTSNYPSQYQGKYFYQDFCNRWINYIDPNTGVRSPFATNIATSGVGITLGNDGNLYYLSRGLGALYKIIYSTNAAPQIISQPQDLTVTLGQSATFSVNATGTVPLEYQWQKEGVDISGATSTSYTINSTVAADAGKYRCVVKNTVGTATSSEAILTITSFNSPPVAQINTPSNGDTYRGGDVISFSGDGNDPEDGNLPASAFTWLVDFRHDTHRHDGPPVAQGAKNGTFQIPVTGETADNVWYRIYLIVVDSQGLKDTTLFDINPLKSLITLESNPPGLQLRLDGQPVLTPYSTLSVEGVQRALSAVSPQTVNGRTHIFDYWEHGGNETHVISTPVNDVTYTAVFIAPPLITSQPQDLIVNSGETATFSVTANGSASFTYQWQKNSADIPGANQASYSIASANTSDAGQYTVTVSNALGSITSSAATLTVNVTAPGIVNQPQSLTTNEGPSVTFTVSATGSAPISYQWEKDGVAITGADQASYTIASVATNDAGGYAVVVSNPVGSVTSNTATLIVNPTVEPPVITGQPQNLTANEGDNIFFVVIVTGTGPFTYQWQKEGNDLPGADAASFRISSVVPGDAGRYRVVVSNQGGSTSSNESTLAVISAPTIDQQPKSQTIVLGESVTFSISAQGGEPLSYQWSKDGSNLSGADQASLTIDSVQPSDMGEYQVVVSNSLGSVTSGKVSLIVIIPPAITSQPVDLTAEIGTTVVFTVEATGSGSLSYQWQKDGTAIAGATQSTYTLDVNSSSDAGQFSVVVSNAAGEAISRKALLTIKEVNFQPIAAIVTPEVGQKYRAGETINFAGDGIDTEDGSLSGRAFRWFIAFYLDGVPQDMSAISAGGSNGSFVIPNQGEQSVDVWYRLYLIVEDSKGSIDTTYRDIYPYVSTLSFDSQPQGLNINIDNEIMTTPFEFKSVEGMLRNIEIPSPQLLDSVAYAFDRWATGITIESTLTTPANQASYIAYFDQIESSQGSVANVDLYPIPAQDFLYLKIFTQDQNRINVSFYNSISSGIEMASYQVTPQSDNLITIPLQNLPSGIYFMRASFGPYQINRKVIIDK